MREHKIKHYASQIRLYAVRVSHFPNNDQNIFMRLIFTAYPHLCTSYALFVLPYCNCITFSKKAFALLRMTALGKVPSMDDDRAQNKALCQSDKAMHYK